MLIDSSPSTVRTRSGIVHWGGNCLPLLPTHSVYSSQIRANSCSNSGGALSASDLVEERVEKEEVEGKEELKQKSQSLGVGFP